MLKVHAYIISSLKKEMPAVFGKDAKKKELIAKLDQIYAQIEREHQISRGDFPDINRMKEQLAHQDFSKFKPLEKKLLDRVDRMLSEDITQLMTMIPQEEKIAFDKSNPVKGGAFEDLSDNPFGAGRGEGIDAGRDAHDWIVSRERDKYDAVFETLNPIDGKITGSTAKQEMIKSKLPTSVLGKVWKLSDVDKDGMLDSDEWALASHLMKLKLEGHEIPNVLPEHLVPPSKR